MPLGFSSHQWGTGRIPIFALGNSFFDLGTELVNGWGNLRLDQLEIKRRFSPSK